MLSGCYIGTDAEGDSNVGNLVGVLVEGANDTVGDSTGGTSTVVSGNQQDGIDVSGGGATGDSITSALIGVGLTGLTALSNGLNGITISAGAMGATLSKNVIAGQVLKNGVDLKDTNGNVVANNYIGLNKAGAPLGNAGDGVLIEGASANNTIGGIGAGGGNFIADNGNDGVHLSGANVHNNTVLGNYIGLDQNGNNQGNSNYGVEVDGGAHDNTIGRIAGGAANVISCNTRGVSISDPGTSQNIVAGNYIGTDRSGSVGTDPNGDTTGNATGVVIQGGASNNTIGGAADGAANVISGNLNDGVLITGVDTMQNVVAGNFIGTDFLGTMATGNGTNGVEVNDEAIDNTVGGSAAGAGNVISGNTGDGVVLSNAVGNVVAGNRIGTDITGATAIDRNGAALGNGGNGVTITLGSFNNTIGGTDAGAANVISGNTTFGVALDDNDTTNNTIAGNFIGTNLGGTAILDSHSKKLGNGADGVNIAGGANDNIVGGTEAGVANVSSGNQGDGVNISANNNLVAGDFIGTNAAGNAALPNSKHGVYISGSNNTIGALAVGANPMLNIISGNAWDGVAINAGSGNLVINSYIGVGADGGVTGAIPNQSGGVSLTNTSDNTIGGNRDAGALNVISGNNSAGAGTGYGVDIWASSTHNHVEGNYIGLASDGATPVWNAKDGVRIESGADNNTIGSTDPEYGNVVSANLGDGIVVLSNGNVIDCNLVGLTATGADPNYPTPPAAAIIPHYLYNSGGVGILIGAGTTGNIRGGSNQGQA